MKKKLIAITLLTLCGGITAAGATSLVKYENHPVEVKAGIIETIAGSKAMSYELALENLYSKEYKINYPEIEEYLNEVIAFLENCRGGTISRDDLEAYIDEVDAKLATYKNDTDELSALKNGLENFISTIDKNEASDTTLINFKNKFLRVSAVFGEETPDEINNLMHYAETGYNAISIISEYITKYSRFLNETDSNSLFLIFSSLIQNLRNKSEDVDSFCETFVNDAKELILSVEDVANEYYKAKQLINEKYSSANQYANYSDLSLIVFEKLLNDTLENLDLAVTIEEISKIVSDFDEQLTHLINQVDMAKIILSDMAKLVDGNFFTSFEQYILDTKAINKVIEENEYAIYFLGSSQEYQNIANNYVKIFEKYLNLYDKVKDNIPDILNTELENGFNSIENYIRTNLNYNFYLHEEVEKQFANIFSSNNIVNIFNAYADSIYNADYNYFNNSYQGLWNSTKKDFSDEISGLSFEEASTKLSEYIDLLESINIDAEKGYQVCQMWYSLTIFNDLESYKQLINQIDELLKDNIIGLNMLGSGNTEIDGARKIVNLFDKYYEKYESIKDELPDDLKDFILECLKALEEYVKDNISLTNEYFFRSLELDFDYYFSTSFIEDRYAYWFNQLTLDEYFNYSDYANLMAEISTEASKAIRESQDFLEAVEYFVQYKEKLSEMNEYYSVVKEYFNYLDDLKRFSFNDDYKNLLLEFKTNYDNLNDIQKNALNDVYAMYMLGKQAYDAMVGYQSKIDALVDCPESSMVILDGFMISYETVFRSYLYSNAPLESIIAQADAQLDEYLEAITRFINEKNAAPMKIEQMIQSSELLRNDPIIDSKREEWLLEVENATTYDELISVYSHINDYENEVEFKKYKEQAKEEIKVFYENLDKTYWSEADLKIQDSLLKKYLNKVETSKTKSAIDRAKEEAFKKLGQINNIGSHTRKGCGSSIASASVIVTLLSGLGVTFVLRKKREENKNN